MVSLRADHELDLESSYNQKQDVDHKFPRKSIYQIKILAKNEKVSYYSVDTYPMVPS